MDQQIVTVTVAALLDTGNPRQVRDFLEDLSAVLGAGEARHKVCRALTCYRFACVARGDAAGAAKARDAEALCGETGPPHDPG
jgi:hypothetical protein